MEYGLLEWWSIKDRDQTHSKIDSQSNDKEKDQYERTRRDND